jgi:hypothetical protein
MRIDSSGKVGIGTTAPDNILHVSTGDASSVTANANSPIVLEANGACYIQFLGPSNGDQGLLFGDDASGSDGYISYNHSGRKMTFSTAGGDRISILSSGFVGIGTTAPDSKFHLGFTGGAADDFILMGSGAAARGVIENVVAGQMLVGVNITHEGDDWKRLRDSHDCIAVRIGHAAFSVHYGGGGTAGTVVTNWDTGDQRFTVASNGVVSGQHGTYHTSSDVRMKKEVVTIDDALAKVTAMRGVNFKWKDEFDADPETQGPVIKGELQTGFIAQEVEVIAPEVINTDPSENAYKAVQDGNQMSAYLVEAIKELSTKVTALENA